MGYRKMVKKTWMDNEGKSMKVLKKEISANGDRRLLITLNKKELEILYGVVSKAYLHTPKIPATDGTVTRLRNMRTEMGKFFKEMKNIN